jgi:hypothetical protein
VICGDTVITPNGCVVFVIGDVPAVEVQYDDGSTAVLPVDQLAPWTPESEP